MDEIPTASAASKNALCLSIANLMQLAGVIGASKHDYEAKDRAMSWLLHPVFCDSGESMQHKLDYRA